MVAQTISVTIEVIQLNLSEVNERDCRSRFATRLMALASSEAISMHQPSFPIKEVGFGGKSLAVFK